MVVGIATLFLSFHVTSSWYHSKSREDRVKVKDKCRAKRLFSFEKSEYEKKRYKILSKRENFYSSQR